MAEQRACEFNAQDWANPAWAFAMVKQSDEKMFTILASGAERRGCEFNARSVANTAWAFATVMHGDEKLFGALARATE